MDTVGLCGMKTSLDRQAKSRIVSDSLSILRCRRPHHHHRRRRRPHHYLLPLHRRRYQHLRPHQLLDHSHLGTRSTHVLRV